MHLYMKRYIANGCGSSKVMQDFFLVGIWNSTGEYLMAQRSLLDTIRGIFSFGTHHASPTCEAAEECLYCAACECNNFQHSVNCVTTLEALIKTFNLPDTLESLVSYWEQGYALKEIWPYPTRGAGIAHRMGHDCRMGQAERTQLESLQGAAPEPVAA